MASLGENQELAGLRGTRDWTTTLLAAGAVTYLIITLTSLILLSCKVGRSEDAKSLETNYQQEIEQLMKTAKKEDQNQQERQENVQDKLDLTELMENSRKSSYTRQQKQEIKDLNLIRAVAYLSLVAGCVLSPLLELHIKCCYNIFSEMEATVNKIEIQNGGFDG